MNTFVLILTMTFPFTGQGQGAAIGTVPGFHTVKGCNDAGKAWVASTQSLATNVKLSYQCVNTNS
jgi:hypothetical protein